LAGIPPWVERCATPRFQLEVELWGVVLHIFEIVFKKRLANGILAQDGRQQDGAGIGQVGNKMIIGHRLSGWQNFNRKCTYQLYS